VKQGLPPRGAIRFGRDIQISTLRPNEIKFVDDLVDFARGRGYVLDFSDRVMSHFFGTLGIDIDDPTYAESGGSKGSRLRTFLRKVDDGTASRILQALWEHRVFMLSSTGQIDPVFNAELRFLSVVDRLSDSSPLGQSAHLVPSPVLDLPLLDELQAELVRIRDMAAQSRGYAFEKFLKRAFEVGGMAPREPFSNRGEQIDGSFVLDGEVYLIEAKWRKASTNAQDLNAFHGKLEGKAAWARGLFVSFNGFSIGALDAFHGRRIILMSGKDMHDSLERRIPLVSVLQKKVRVAGETGCLFVPVEELFPA